MSSFSCTLSFPLYISRPLSPFLSLSIFSKIELFSFPSWSPNRTIEVLTLRVMLINILLEKKLENHLNPSGSPVHKLNQHCLNSSVIVPAVKTRRIAIRTSARTGSLAVQMGNASSRHGSATETKTAPTVLTKSTAPKLPMKVQKSPSCRFQPFPRVSSKLSRMIT